MHMKAEPALTSSRPGRSLFQTALTTSASTPLLPMSAAAAANTLGMLATLACHASFSTAQPKHCEAFQAPFVLGGVAASQQCSVCTSLLLSLVSAAATTNSMLSVTRHAHLGTCVACGWLAPHLHSNHGGSHRDPLIQRGSQPAVHAAEADARDAYPGRIHIRPRVQVIQQDHNVPNIVQQEGPFNSALPCPGTTGRCCISAACIRRAPAHGTAMDNGASDTRHQSILVAGPHVAARRAAPSVIPAQCTSCIAGRAGQLWPVFSLWSREQRVHACNRSRKSGTHGLRPPASVLSSSPGLHLCWLLIGRAFLRPCLSGIEA